MDYTMYDWSGWKITGGYKAEGALQNIAKSYLNFSYLAENHLWSLKR